MPVSILIGNGFNRINKQQQSWEELLMEIAKDVGDSEIMRQYAYKPETFTFEQLAYADNRSNREIQIKRKIAKAMQSLEHNTLHSLCHDLKPALPR